MLSKIEAHAKTIQVGHGSQDCVNVGPLSTPRGVEKAHRLVEDAVKRGAKVAHEGRSSDLENGYFFQPIVLRNMDSSMAITQEECFTQIAALYKFKTEDMRLLI